MWDELPGEIQTQPDPSLKVFMRIEIITQSRANRAAIMDETLLELSRSRDLSGERISQLLGRAKRLYEIAENALPWHAV